LQCAIFYGMTGHHFFQKVEMYGNCERRAVQSHNENISVK
jgi:hypothetical protein